MADAGDSIEDGAGILRLCTFIEWVHKMIELKLCLRTGFADTFNDKVFLTELDLKTKETCD